MHFVRTIRNGQTWRCRFSLVQKPTAREERRKRAATTRAEATEKHRLLTGREVQRGSIWPLPFRAGLQRRRGPRGRENGASRALVSPSPSALCLISLPPSRRMPDLPRGLRKKPARRSLAGAPGAWRATAVAGPKCVQGLPHRRPTAPPDDCDGSRPAARALASNRLSLARSAARSPRFHALAQRARPAPGRRSPRPLLAIEGVRAAACAI